MSLADFRKELREMRKTDAVPVSKMKKEDVVRELERRKAKAEKAEAKVAEVKPVPDEKKKLVAERMAKVRAGRKPKS